MRTWAEFKALRSIVFEMPAHVFSDLLMSDFGLGSEWEMVARESILRSRSTKAALTEVDVPIHPDALQRLHWWLSAYYPANRSYVETADKRLARLRDRAGRALAEWEAHPFFHGRQLQGAWTAETPAWHDGYFLRGCQADGYRPVILAPVVGKAANGSNITGFTIEEVEWPSP